MINKIFIKNFKSVYDLEFEPGRVNVLIGENGSGKSNILEAIAFGAASAADKLDHEFLASRGIRATEAEWMRSGFEMREASPFIYLQFIVNSASRFSAVLSHESEIIDQWKNIFPEVFISKVSSETRANLIRKYGLNIDPGEAYQYPKGFPVSIGDQGTIGLGQKGDVENLLIEILKIESKSSDHVARDTWRQVFSSVEEKISSSTRLFVKNFVVYSPENTSLRSFRTEGQILPLGIHGEGLFDFLKKNAAENPSLIKELKGYLQFIDWFEDMEIKSSLLKSERTLSISDRYVDPELRDFDERSANEGFLFLLFYFSLFISKDTPKFFAVDNIDASLNPKLCRELMIILTELAKKYDKQVIFTTHNPSILDGLNLHDDEQRLFVVRRNRKGHTVLDRVERKEGFPGRKPVKLSEAFMSGYLGGLPTNF